MNLGVVAGLTVVLTLPVLHGLLTGATSPLGAAVRLLAALVAAMVAEAVLRRLLRPEPAAAAPATTARPGPASAQPGVLPDAVAEQLRSSSGG